LKIGNWKLEMKEARKYESTKGQKYECRGEKFFAPDRKHEDTKGTTNAVIGRHERTKPTTPVIAIAAKQPSLQARRSQSRAFAKTLRFFLDWLRRARYASVVFVAVLLAMTRLCYLCGISRLRTFHFQSSIFNLQLMIVLMAFMTVVSSCNMKDSKMEESVNDKMEKNLQSEGDATNRVENVEIEMVYVAGGTFTMGCTAEQGDDCFNGEKPAHQVTLNDYYIGKYEVTQAQWKAIMGNNPSHFKGCDNCPVERVSWHEIQEFISKLNQKTGKNYRLPTEAEWEYAARGGKQSKGYKYSGSDNADEVAWYDDNSNYETHPVGQKAANELGIYDMSGNVLEWCSDWYENYANASQTNPKGSSTGSLHVNLGGSWYSSVRNVRVSARDGDIPNNHNADLGFRLARSLK
jgi:formylglycine-generating enzyme required for sulfatase activity